MQFFLPDGEFFQLRLHAARAEALFPERLGGGQAMRFHGQGAGQRFPGQVRHVFQAAQMLDDPVQVAEHEVEHLFEAFQVRR